MVRLCQGSVSGRPGILAARTAGSFFSSVLASPSVTFQRLLSPTRWSFFGEAGDGDGDASGVEPGEAVALLAALNELPSLRVEGVYTHFATPDETDKSHSAAQFARFTEVLRALEGVGLRPPLAHAANSAALLTMTETHLDVARAGIALYGLDPDDQQCPLPPEFRPALCWKALVAHVRLQPPDLHRVHVVDDRGPEFSVEALRLAHAGTLATVGSRPLRASWKFCLYSPRLML